MTDHAWLRDARDRLGLTRAQLAALLDTDAQSVQRMEMPRDRSTARPLAPRVVRLVEAYLEGYRPEDWPSAPPRE